MDIGQHADHFYFVKDGKFGLFSKIKIPIENIDDLT